MGLSGKGNKPKVWRVYVRRNKKRENDDEAARRDVRIRGLVGDSVI
jgi:hypothetical protein